MFELLKYSCWSAWTNDCDKLSLWRHLFPKMLQATTPTTDLTDTKEGTIRMFIESHDSNRTLSSDENESQMEIALEMDFELKNKAATKFTFTTPSLDFLEHSELLRSQLLLLKQIIKSFPTKSIQLRHEYLTIFNKLTRPPQKRIKPEVVGELSSTHDFDPTLSNSQKSLYFYLRGELLRLINRFKESKYNLERSIKLNPLSQESWNALGKLYMKMERFEDSMEAFEFILRIDPNNYKAYYRLGQIQQILGRDIEKCIKLYKQNVRLESTYSKGWLGLGLALVQKFMKSMNLQDARLAIAALSQSEKLGCKSQELFEKRAHCFQYLDKIDESIADFLRFGNSNKVVKRHCANLQKYKRELTKEIVPIY